MAERRKLLGLVACAMVAACSQLLGIDDLGYHPDGAAADGPIPDAPPDAFRPCDASPTDDPRNCGSCGHDCLGGRCTAGVCGPATMYSVPGLSSALATDGKSVFFRTPTQIQGCLSSSAVPCNPTTLAGSLSGPTQFLAAAAGYVYWSDGNAVRGCATTQACSPMPYLTLSGSAVLYGIGAVIGAPSVLAVDYNYNGTGAIRVWRIDLGGTNPHTVISFQPGGGAPGPIAATPGAPNAYWSQVSTPTLYDCLMDSCGATPTSSIPSSSPAALVTTGSLVYVATSTGVDVTDGALGGATAHLMGTGTSPVNAMAIDPNLSQFYYVEQSTAWNIQACPAGATPCTPALVYTTPNAITAIAADGTALYWIEASSASPSVMRLVL